MGGRRLAGLRRITAEQELVGNPRILLFNFVAMVIESDRGESRAIGEELSATEGDDVDRLS